MITMLLLSLAIFSSPGTTQTKPTYDMLFIHHSVGYGWLHAGGLVHALPMPHLVGGRNINVHSASYGDTIGDHTDTCHWRKKFRDQMDQVLTFDQRINQYYKTPGRYNRIVMFKSCYPNSVLPSIGTLPGDPDSTQRTLINYMATMEELTLLFDDYPHVLFIYVTSPPLNAQDPAWSRNASQRHRGFCKWLNQTWVPGYQKDTGLKNLAVFNLFDVLAESETHATIPNALKLSYANGNDSHPLPAGYFSATTTFLPWFISTLDTLEKSSHGGCAQVTNQFPWLHANGRASIRNPIHSLTVDRVPPASVGILLCGIKPSPLGLGNNCFLMTSPDVTWACQASPTKGSFSIPMAFPMLTPLVGRQLYFQSINTDLNGSFLGSLNFSNLLRVKVLF